MGELEIKSRKRIRLAIGVFAAMIILICAAGIPYLSYKSFIISPLQKGSREIEFKIEKGANSSSIIEELYHKKLIRSKLFGKIYYKLNGKKSLKAGLYKFNTSITPAQLFKELQKGAKDYDVIRVTFPEGYNIKQIAEELQTKGLISSTEGFIKEAKEGKFDYDFLKDIPKDRDNPLEGYMFPDTYEFKKGATDHEIIDKMLERFKQKYDSKIAGNLKDKTLDELIIMASIVEREAKVESERPLIAAVFYNRLKNSMRLESCATIQYALGYNKEKLLYKDLEIKSPYNTYKNDGLPIGPICSPGEKSILAALKPADVDYMFFVLKAYNGDGSHNFARNYNEFLKYKNQLK